MINIENPPYIESPNKYASRNKPVQLIVVHTMESQENGDTAENVAKNWFALPKSGVSAHYCVDNNSVVQCVLDGHTAWHCRNANANGIGIELAGKASQRSEDWMDAYSIAELEIAAELGAYLCHKFKIPVRRAVFASPTDSRVIQTGFCGHRDVPGHGTHSDPGVNFPFDYFLTRVAYYFEVRSGK